MNLSTNLEVVDNIIQNSNFAFHILDHPMKPFAIRYWNRYFYGYNNKEEYLESFEFPQACSWLRDQEYMLDFEYFDELKYQDWRWGERYLHIFSKIRYVM